MKRPGRRGLLIIAVAAIVVIAALAYAFSGGNGGAVTYRFGAIDRGDLVTTISTSGTWARSSRSMSAPKSPVKSLN